MKAVSTIGPKTVVRGNVHGEGDLTIEGRVEGDVNVDGNVSVAPMAEVKGSIAAANVSIAGTVEGDVSSADTLTVDPNAKILGDMTGPRVHIAEGAIVRGMVRTEGEPRHTAPERLTRQTPEDASERKNEQKLPKLLELASESLAAIQEQPARDKQHKKRKDKHKKRKRPPEPVVPVLAKRTKGKKKGEKRAH